MANWFENNPTKSVIAYTLLIAGSTWAASTFILQENRLNLAKSELESQRSLTEQYKAKTELLEKDIEVLRRENAEYREWLGKTKDPVPLIAPQMAALRAKVAALQAETEAARRSNPLIPPSNFESSASVGTAFIDDRTGVVVTVKKTDSSRVANIRIKFPDRDPAVEATVVPGQSWKFKFKGQPYQLIVTQISFITDTVRFRISADQK